MVENSIRCRLLEFYPLSYKIRECLRLDGFTGSKIYVECSELDCPLGYAFNYIPIA
jgi:hypothetical protein